MAGIVVLATTATKREARKIVRSLLKKRLAACANILGPIDSQFWWQDKIDEAKEYLLLLKSDEKLFEKLAQTIREMHSYKVPEVLAVPIMKGWLPYLEWLSSTLYPPPKR